MVFISAPRRTFKTARWDVVVYIHHTPCIHRQTIPKALSYVNNLLDFQLTVVTNVIKRARKVNDSRVVDSRYFAPAKRASVIFLAQQPDINRSADAPRYFESCWISSTPRAECAALTKVVRRRSLIKAFWYSLPFLFLLSSHPVGNSGACIIYTVAVWLISTHLFSMVVVCRI